MSRVSPTLEGFRAVFRRPSFTLAEIAWRWAIGACAWGLLFFGIVEYLGSLAVGKTDAALLSTGQPLLMERAIAHIFRGSLNQAVFAALLAVFSISFLWIAAASFGRSATVRALLDYFHERFAEGAQAGMEESKPGAPGSLIGLNFLRMMAALAALLALMGAAILASFASPEANPQPMLAFLLFLPLAGLIGMVWFGLNWLLSLALVFTVRDGEDAIGAIAAATGFCREHLGAVLAVSTWTGAGHLTAFVFAFSLASFPLAFIHVVPWRLAMGGVIVVVLAYFAVADWLYMARLAGYICIAEMPEALRAASPPLAPMPPPVPLQTTIDRDEPILSDIPGLPAET